MSSEQSQHSPMTEFEVRAGLKRVGVTQKQIAAELETTQSLVSLVVSGRGWEGSTGRRIMERVAQALSVPVHIAFPHAERRQRPFPTEAAA
jgi:predicted transcriptional regulator